MTELELQLRQVEIPSKWDIIPIHTSDIANFNRCRRYWDWTSPTRTNLRHRVDVYGINFNLWFGTGIHYALEKMYDPMLNRDPVEVFKTWFQYQWEGGVVGEEWLELTYDIHPRLLVDVDDMDSAMSGGNPTWHIAGLRDILPEPIEEEFLEWKNLGINMLEYYKDYAQRKDDFEVIAVESTYSIPLGFECIDKRENSPNYGKMLEVHARGKRDKIVWYPEKQKFGITDYKTTARVDEDFFLKFEKDPQLTNYLWATKAEAEHYEMPWYANEVDRIVITALRKNYPKPPTVLKSGFLSVNRQEEGTTSTLFMEAVKEHGLEMWYEDDEKAQAYVSWLEREGEQNFVIRHTEYRNEYEIKAAGEHLTMMAKEMLDEDIYIWPNPTGAKSCLQCAFRVPCIAKDDGNDWQGMLVDSYEVNRDR